MLRRSGSSRAVAGQLCVDGVAHDISNLLLKPKLEREEQFYPIKDLSISSGEAHDRYFEHRRGISSIHRNALYAKSKSLHNVHGGNSGYRVHDHAPKEDPYEPRGRRWSSAIPPRTLDKLASWRTIGGNERKDPREMLEAKKKSPPPSPQASVDVVLPEIKQGDYFSARKEALNLKKPPSNSSLKLASSEGPVIASRRSPVSSLPFSNGVEDQPGCGSPPDTTRHSQINSTASSPHANYSADYLAAGPPHAAYENGHPSQEDFEDENSLTIEIAPGVTECLRGSLETTEAFQLGNVVEVRCFCCDQDVTCVADAAYFLCPNCKVVSPVPGENTADFGKPRRGSWGVGLGFVPQNLSM